jgi:4-amino-4-deoxy-L-arabinose transferase-like glycosyltransferase
MDNKLLILIILLILATTFRLVGSDRSMIGDEYDWAISTNNFVLTGIPFEHIGCYGEPVYFYRQMPFLFFASGFWIEILGFSDFAVRMGLITFGILTVLITYLIGKELFSKRTGLIAAFLMAISRYHVSASQTVSNDGAIMTFFGAAAILFFIMYKKKQQNGFLILSIVAIALSIFSKIYGFLFIAPILIYSFILKNKVVKKDWLILLSIPLSAMILLAFASMVGDISYFWGPINYIPGEASENNLYIASLNEMLFDKLSYVAKITWLLTPFLSILVLLSIFSWYRNRNKNLILPLAWLFVVFFMFLLPFGADKQRYFSAALPSIFLLTAVLFDKIKINKQFTIKLSVVAIISFLLSVIFTVNDINAIYNPFLYLAVYLVAAVIMIPKSRVILLLGAFIGSSVFFASGINAWEHVESYAVKDLSNKVLERGYPHNEVYAGKDVRFYITPKDQAVIMCTLDSLDKDYIISHDLKYIAAYSLQEEEKLKEFLPYCKDPYTLYMDNHLIGYVCEKA